VTNLATLMTGWNKSLGMLLLMPRSMISLGSFSV